MHNLSSQVQVPEETGQTYEENAQIKATAVGQQTGLLTVADDSGLEIAALPGQWGVKSARQFLGDSHARNQFVLEQLQDEQNRNAKYVCVAVLYNPKTKQSQSFRGELFGNIVAAAGKGEQGFGFDPIFMPNGYSQTFAELGPEIKNSISHRAVAFRALVEYVTNLKEKE